MKTFLKTEFFRKMQTSQSMADCADDGLAQAYLRLQAGWVGATP
jgi:hypothetical protein